MTKQFDYIFRYIPKMELHVKIGLTCFHKMATNLYLRKCGFNHTVIGRAWSLRVKIHTRRGSSSDVGLATNHSSIPRCFLATTSFWN